MSGILNIKLESIQDELTGIEYGGNLNILPNYSKLPAFFAQLSGTVTGFKLREFAIRNSEYIHIKDVAITGNIEAEGSFIKYVGSAISIDDALNYNAKIFDYYFNLDGVAYKSSKFIVSDLEVPSLVTLRIIDPHSDVQESVKVYESGSLLGETDVNGEIEVVSGSNLILGKSGFFIKSYVSTESKNQDVTLNYVVPTVKIGTQIWQSENLAIDDLQGGVKPPAGDQVNILNYGALYKFSRIDIITLLIPSFSKSIGLDYSLLISNLGGFDIAGGKLKETGIIYWNSPNTGATNESGFNGRGAGYYRESNDLYYEFKSSCWLGGDSSNLIRILSYSSDDIVSGGGLTDDFYRSYRCVRSTPDTFIFSISVNSGGAAVQGATVSVEGNDYTTDINGQVFIEEYKTSVNYSVSKTGYDTVNGSIDLTSEFTKIVTLTVNSPSISNVNVSNTTTSGGSDGSITITATGGVSPYEYSIDGGVNYQSSNIFANLISGQYTLRVRDANLSLSAIQISTVGSDVLAWHTLSTGIGATPTSGGLKISANANDIVITGRSGLIYNSSDAGKTWVSRSSGTTEDLFDVFYIDGVFFAVGDVHTVLKSVDRGVTWSNLNVTGGASEDYKSTYWQSELIGYICGGDGVNSIIKKTIDGGLNWTTMNISSVNAFSGIVFKDANNGAASRFDGKIYKTTDGGVNWVDSGFVGLSSSNYISYGNGLWITGGSGGKLFKTTDLNSYTDISFADTNIRTFDSEIEDANNFEVINSFTDNSLQSTINGGTSYIPTSFGVGIDFRGEDAVYLSSTLKYIVIRNGDVVKYG